MTKPQILGLIGLGTMGRGFALNLMENGITVYGFDNSKESITLFKRLSNSYASERMEDFVKALPRPRKIFMLVPFSEVGAVVTKLLPLLELGDIIVDAGNSHYLETRSLQLKTLQKGVELIGLGVSGGHHGARNGASFMAGGNVHAIKDIEPMLLKVAAKNDDGSSCFINAGPDGAGHFVKMVHNGIEYADMQCLAEAVYLLKKLFGMSPDSISDVLDEWNRTEHASYLLDATIAVLRAKCGDGDPLLDKIHDAAKNNGTGRWAAMASLELGVSAPTIVAALDARIISNQSALRAKIKTLRRIKSDGGPLNEIEINDLKSGLLSSRTLAFSQGFSLLETGSKFYGWNINLAQVAKVWANGCIIKGSLLENALNSFRDSKHIQDGQLLYCAPYRDIVLDGIDHLRKIIGWAVQNHAPVPAMSSCLTYWDSLSQEKLWTSLIQGQRNFFGNHIVVDANGEEIINIKYA